MEALTLREDLAVRFVAWIDRTPKTTATYTTNLRQFVAWLRYSGIENPTRDDVINYRAWLQSPHDAIRATPEGWEYRTDAAGRRIRITCSANTTAQYLRSVSQFFRWTAASGYYPNIAENIHPPKIRTDTHRKEALTPADIQAIDQAIQETPGSTEQRQRLRAMFLLAATAGLRCIELSRANIEDLEIRRGQAWLYVQGKGHSEADQKKALAQEVQDAINQYLRTKGAKRGPIFTATGNRSQGRLAPETISRHLKGALIAAGYDSPRITAHSLRHTAGTTAQRVTGDLYATQKYMRHSNPATTEIYLHIEDEDQDAAIAQAISDAYQLKTPNWRR